MQSTQLDFPYAWRVEIERRAEEPVILVVEEWPARGATVCTVNPHRNPFDKGTSAEDVAKVLAHAPAMLKALRAISELGNKGEMSCESYIAAANQIALTCLLELEA